MPSTFTAFHAVGVKLPAPRFVAARSACVISSTRPARTRVVSRDAWATATSGGRPPIVASDSLV